MRDRRRGSSSSSSSSYNHNNPNNPLITPTTIPKETVDKPNHPDSVAARQRRSSNPNKPGNPGLSSYVSEKGGHISAEVKQAHPSSIQVSTRAGSAKGPSDPGHAMLGTRDATSTAATPLPKHTAITPSNKPSHPNNPANNSREMNERRRLSVPSTPTQLDDRDRDRDRNRTRERVNRRDKEEQLRALQRQSPVDPTPSRGRDRDRRHRDRDIDVAEPVRSESTDRTRASGSVNTNTCNSSERAEKAERMSQDKSAGEAGAEAERVLKQKAQKALARLETEWQVCHAVNHIYIDLSYLYISAYYNCVCFNILASAPLH